MERTGNRWRDQDKIRNPDGSLKPREQWENDPSTLANADNIIEGEFKGTSRKPKYGPALMGEPAKPAGDRPLDAPQTRADVAELSKGRAERAAAAVAAAHAPPAQASELEDINPNRLGKAFADEIKTPGPVQAKTPDPLPGGKDDMPQVKEELKTILPLAQKGDVVAAARMNELAQAEFARTDGGRMPIIKLLNAYHITKPTKKEE